MRNKARLWEDIDIILYASGMTFLIILIITFSSLGFIKRIHNFVVAVFQLVF